jgi:hypothetical protein
LDNNKREKMEFVDPDDAPELTDDFFEHADLYNGDNLIKKGKSRKMSKDLNENEQKKNKKVVYSLKDIKELVQSDSENQESNKQEKQRVFLCDR